MFPWASASQLYDSVTNHSNSQEWHQDVQLNVSAQEVAVSEWNDKAERLPETKVGKSCWCLIHEQTPIQCYSNKVHTTVIIFEFETAVIIINTILNTSNFDVFFSNKTVTSFITTESRLGYIANYLLENDFKDLKFKYFWQCINVISQ